MTTSDKSQDELRVVFKNEAPDDTEWSAHIRVLNEWQNPERTLRDIIQYARSGPFYPADMHVDLIQQLIAANNARVAAEAVITEMNDMIASLRKHAKDFKDSEDADVLIELQGVVHSCQHTVKKYGGEVDRELPIIVGDTDTEGSE